MAAKGQQMIVWGLGGVAVLALVWFAAKSSNGGVVPNASGQGYSLNVGAGDGGQATAPGYAPATFNIPNLIYPPDTSATTGAPIIFNYTPAAPAGISFGTILPDTTAPTSGSAANDPCCGGCGDAGSGCSNCPNGSQTSYGDTSGIAGVLAPFIQKLVSAMPQGVVAPGLFDPGASNVFQVEDQIFKNQQRALFSAGGLAFASGQTG